MPNNKQLTKKKLYILLKKYIDDEINTVNFCEEFSITYDLKIDHDQFSVEEGKIFKILSTYVDRHSPFEEDFIKHPNVYYTDQEIREKAEETARLLDSLKK